MSGMDRCSIFSGCSRFRFAQRDQRRSRK